jgi:hypothetical protein
MRNLIILILTAALVAGGCKKASAPVHILLGECEFPPYDSYPERLEGNIKKIVQKSYIAVRSGSSLKKGRIIARNERDSRGLISDFTSTFDKRGHYITNWLIDEKNYPFVRMEFSTKDTLPDLAKTWFEKNYVGYQKIRWNDEGKITGYTSYNPATDSVINSMEVSYFPGTDSIVHQWYTNRHEPLIKQVYHYDSNGNFTGRESYNNRGEFRSKIVVRLNDKGKIGQMTIMDKNLMEVYSRSITYDYDKSGNWIVAICIDDKGVMVYQERKYTYY